MTRQAHLRASAAALSAAFAIWASPAQAQVASDEPNAASDQEDGGFAEIIVTAQKREQALQDIPVAVSAFDAQIIQDAGVRDLKDLIILAPSLMVTSTASESITTARIRGIGTIGDNPGLESSVGIAIDGVYRARNSVGFGDLGEIERIEVLRGPQGTLFGKNTSAGVISVTTAPPQFDVGANAQLTVGNYNLRGLDASLTGPLIEDKVAARAYVGIRARDGLMDVVTGNGPRTETRDINKDYFVARGQILIAPSERASLRIIADYTRRDEFCCSAATLFAGPSSVFIDQLASNSGILNPVQASALTQPPTRGLNRLVPGRPFERIAYSDRNTTQKVTDRGVSGELTWEIGGASLTSVSAWRRWSTLNGADADFTTADILLRPDDGTNAVVFNQISQELRLQGVAWNDRLDWLVGGFYADEDLTRRDAITYGADYQSYISLLLTNGADPQFVRTTLAGIGFPTTAAALPSNGGQRDRAEHQSRSIALFTHNSLAVSDAITVTAGLRWTSEDKSARSEFTTNAPGCAAIETLLGDDLAAALPAAQLGSLAAVRAAALGGVCLPWARSALDGQVFHQERSEQELSGTVKVDYKVADDLMVYASYARGYKAGGFNLDRALSGLVVTRGGAATPTNPTGIVSTAITYRNVFPAETVDSYEIGLKSTAAGGDILLNVVGFVQDFQDFQLNAFTGLSFIVSPIPKVRSQGVEVETGWRTPVRGLTLTGNVAYVDTRYDDQPFSTGSIVTDITLPGARLGLSPAWYVNGTIDYERPVTSGLVFRSNLSGRWVSETNTGPDLLPAKLQKAFALFNVRASVGTPDDRWRFELWSQNLLDQDYIQASFNGPLQGASGLSATNRTYDPLRDTITYGAYLGAPRTFGATLRVVY